jgi:hypothetical protein
MFGAPNVPLAPGPVVPIGHQTNVPTHLVPHLMPIPGKLPPNVSLIPIKPQWPPGGKGLTVCAPPPPHPLTHARSTYASSQSLQRLPSRLVRSVFNGGERTIFNGAVALAGLFTCDGAPCYMSPSWGDFHAWRLADVHASVAIADCCDGQSGVEVFQGIAHYSGRSPSCHDVHRHYRQ